MTIKIDEKEIQEKNLEVKPKDANEFHFSETVCHADFQGGCVESEEDED